MLLWAGVILYIVYTFIIYSFDIHFNRLFIIYCFTLRLSLYSLLWFVYSTIRNNFVFEMNRTVVIKTTAVYLLVISLLFYFLWLSEIIPANIDNTSPPGLVETELFTNPVQAIDLSILLPGIFITGLLIFKRNPLGNLFAPVLLTFFILMNVTIGWLSFLMNKNGLEADISVAYVMTVLAIISAVLLASYLKHLKIKKV